MKLRWPFMLRATHERVVDDLAHESADKLLEAERARLQDLREAVAAIDREILKERARCASVARGAPTAARGSFVRDHILHGIEAAPTPRTTHPDIPREEKLLRPVEPAEVAESVW